jgi:hypothetical protein
MRTAALLLLFASMLAPLPALSACPPDSVGRYVYDGPLRGYQTAVLLSPTFEEHLFYSYPIPQASAWEDLRYDMTRGEFALRSIGEASSNMGIISTEVAVALHDSFWIVGPPSAAPIEFLAHLRLTVACSGEHIDDWMGGRFFPGGLVTAHLGRIGGTSVSYANATDVSGVVVLSLPVTQAVGVPFELRMAATAEGTPAPDMALDIAYGNTAAISGLLGFEGLPPGYTIVSCQGWTEGTPVPARRATWGSLKSRVH